MQWLIDMAMDAMEQWIYDNGIYRNRGDPAANDWLIGAFTRDGAWHELDLSTIVPENAKAVALTAMVAATTVGAPFEIRRHGNANAIAIAQMKTQVAFIHCYGDLVCAVDADRKIDYHFSHPGVHVYTAGILTVKGWWL